MRAHLAVALDLAAGQCGLVTRRALLAAGVPNATIHRWCRLGIMQVVAPGVYRLHAGPDRWQAAWRAVLAAAYGAVVSHRTAAWFHDLLPWPDDDMVHVTVRGPAPRQVPGVRVHTSRLMPIDECIEVDGLPATAGGRTVIDCCGVLPSLGAQQLAADAIRRGLTSRRELRELRDRRPRLPGTAALADLLDDARVDRLRSWLEAKFFPLLRASGLAFDVNQRVGRDGSAIQNTVDIVLRDAPVVAELDGFRFHATSREKAHDDRQQNDLALDGWTVLRYSFDDVRRRPAAVVAELQAAVAHHRRGGR